MPSGHTDRDTINQRRPLTANMRDVLAWADTRDRAASRLAWDSLSPSGRNAMRALHDRGLVECDIGGRDGWHPTDAGRAELERLQAAGHFQ